MPVEIKKIEIRTIEEKDNVPLSKLIRQTLEEFGTNLQGTQLVIPGTLDAICGCLKNFELKI